jgi:ribokinase
MKAARDKGIESIINPAPAIPLPDEAYRELGHLIVNETEAAILSGIENPTNWDEVATVFISRGVKNVIITLGGEVSSASVFLQPLQKQKLIHPVGCILPHRQARRTI